MNQLSLIPSDRHAIDLSARRQASSGVRRLATARANLRVGSLRPLACHWRRDAATGALLCVWAVCQGGREPASTVPLRRAG
jgi:hypothetical protein